MHAPSATPDGKDGLIVIFNMNPAKPTPGWDQIMTVPRRITLQGTEGLDRDALFQETGRRCRFLARRPCAD